MTAPAPRRCCPCPPPGQAAGMLLCDCPPDGGDCVQFVRVYADDGTVTDFALDGGEYTPIPGGTVGACGADGTGRACESPTTPVAVAHLCLADGTPIAVVVQRDCDGTVSAPGWVDLATGTYTAGPVPADAAPCDQTVTGGSAGRIPLCDVQADGAVVGFLRAIAGDGTVTDTTLDGASYIPTGTVQLCDAMTSPCASPTTPLATTGLCLPDGTPIATVSTRDCDGVVSQDGWINLRTGAFATGLPPAGAIACGGSQSIQVSGVFCDTDPATGDVYALVLIEYTYDEAGAIESVRIVRADDGTTYVLQGELSICPGTGTSMDIEGALLCLTGADGTLIQQVWAEYGYDTTTGTRLFVRLTDPTTGAAVSPPAGATVGECAGKCTTVTQEVLCDSTPVDAAVAAVDTDPGFLYGPSPAFSVVHASDAQVLWDGGQITVGPSPIEDTFTYAAAVLTADCPPCANPDAEVALAVSLHIRLDGPNPGVASTGGIFLRGPDGTIASSPNPSGTPVGYDATRTVSGTVTLADLMGGRIRFGVGMETNDSGPKAWTLDGFAVTASVTGAGCGNRFVRTYVRDCDTGAISDTFDTDLDGGVYVVSGDVAPCQDRGGCAPPGMQPCRQTTTVLQLCDLNPAAEPNPAGLRCPVPFLRTVVKDCDGRTVETIDTTLDGVTAYEPFQVVDCGGGQSLREQVWNTVSVAPDPDDTTNSTFIYTIANSEDSSQTGTVRMVASEPYGGGCGGTPEAPVWNAPVTFRFEPDETVLELAHVLRIDALDWDTWEAKSVGSTSPLPFKVESELGHTQTGTRTWRSDANNNTGYFYFAGPPEVVAMGSGNTGGGLACTAPAFGIVTLVPGPPCGAASGGTDVESYPLCVVAADGSVIEHVRREVVYDGAGVVVNARYVNAATGAPVTVPDGATVAVCPDECRHCTDRVLCDDGGPATPATINGTVATGTLPNGVTWQARGTNANWPARETNADGAWWAIGGFPNPTIGPVTYTFSRPVDVTFSVALHYVDGANQTHVQIPVNSEPVSLPPGYHYDAAAGVVSGDETLTNCATITDPTKAASARFRLRGITSFTMRFLGVRAAICGQFGNFALGGIDVVPAAAKFVRTICRGCDGEIIGTPIDTAMDGVTPYTPSGTITACETCSCQPEPVCIQQDPVQVRSFISNADHIRDNSVDPVWEWSPENNGLPLADPDFGPAADATWYDMYRPQNIPADRWSIEDTDTERPAFWITPHPDASFAQADPPLPGEGPSVPGNADWFGRAYFDLPANADPSSIKVQVTVLNADQYARAFRLNDGAWQTIDLVDDLGQQGGCFEAGPPENCEPYTFPAQPVPGAQAGRNTLYMRVHETVGGAAGVIAHMIVTYEVSPPARRSWTRMRCCDGSFYYVDESGLRHDDVPEGWVVAPCTSGASAPVLLCDANGPFLRHVTYLADGSVSVSNTSVDGGEYAPVGVVGACGGGGGGGCAATTTTVVLCDTLDGGTPPGPAAVDFATLGGPYPDAVALANGVTVSVDQGGYIPLAPNPPGALFLGASGTDPQVWTFSQPSTVRFRISPATISGDTCIQLPAGAVVEAVQPGVTYNAAANTLCQSGAITTDVGTTVRVDNTSGFQIAVVSGSDPGNNDWFFRFMEVTPDGAAPGGTTAFLRHVVTDCTGAVVDVHDTLLDGVTAYLPGGTVTVCQGAATEMAAALSMDALVARHLDVVPGSPWTPGEVGGGRGITSLGYTVLAGTATVVDAAGESVAGLPAGYSGTWTNDGQGDLVAPQSITADAESRVLVSWTER